MSLSNVTLNHDPNDVSCLDPSVAALLEPCDASERRVRIAMMKLQQSRIRGNSDYAAKIMEHAIEEGAKDRQAWTLLDDHMKKLEAELAAVPPKEEKDDKKEKDEEEDKEDDGDKEDTKEEDKKEDGEEDNKVTSEEVEKLKKEVEAEKEKTKAMEDLLVECLEEELGSVRAEQISIADREARLKARIRSLQQQIPKVPETSEAAKKLEDSLKEIQENQCIYLDTQCSVCHEQKASKAVIPCGHLCMCDGCNQSLERLPSGMRKCPLCRGPLLSTLHIYTSK